MNNDNDAGFRPDDSFCADNTENSRDAPAKKRRYRKKQRERAKQLQVENDTSDFVTTCHEDCTEQDTGDFKKAELFGNWDDEDSKKTAKKKTSLRFGDWDADIAADDTIRNGNTPVVKQTMANDVMGRNKTDTSLSVLSEKPDVSTGRDKLKNVGNAALYTAVTVSNVARNTISKATGEKDDNASSDVLNAGEKAGSSVTRFGFHETEKVADSFSDTVKEVPEFKPDYSIGMNPKPKSREQVKKEANRKRLNQKRLFLQRKAKKAAKAGKNTAEGTKKTVSIGKFMMDTVLHGSKVLIGIILFVVLLIVFGGQGAMSVMPTTIEAVSMEKAAQYQSPPARIDAADLKLSAMELGLRDKIDSIEEDYPDFEEYSYTLDDIGHDPYTLINYLSAQYGTIGDDAMAEIDSLFEAMYELKLTEVEDVRTRWVPKPEEEPEEDDEEEEEGDESEDEEKDSGEDDEDDDEEDESELIEEEYTVKVLKVELISHSLGAIVDSRLSDNAEKRAMYQLYSSTKGLMQILGSPVASSWSVKSYYGYRRNPVTEEPEAHKGLDIYLTEGTQIISSLSGKVTVKGYSEMFGNYVTVTNEEGFAVSYAHLNHVYVEQDQEVAMGDAIGLSGGGSSEEGSCLHMEFTVNGNYFNPLFYTKNEGGTITP